MESEQFDTTIQAGDRGGAFVEVPTRIVRAFGGQGRIAVCAHFDGEPYRGSIVRMGGRSLLGMTLEIRKAIGRSAGDRVQVKLEVDAGPREVEVPGDLAGALAASPTAATFFEGLAYTYRREYVELLTGAKRAETRERRLQKILEKLERGEKQ
jgi:hypothetical protein